MGLAGCLWRGLPGARGNADRTVYVGADLWGFVLLDDEGNEYEQLTVQPGYNPVRGPMGGGMMLHPVPLPHDAPWPTVVGLVASERGDSTSRCLTYCGSGHPYMELGGAFLVPEVTTAASHLATPRWSPDAPGAIAPSFHHQCLSTTIATPAPEQTRAGL